MNRENKRGNSNWKERTRLIDRFIRLFGAECIDSLVANRTQRRSKYGAKRPKAKK